MDRIRIDQVVTDRDIDAAEPLPSDPDIVRVPIVIGAEGNILIDGLRRLRYWRDCGAKTIGVIKVRTVDEAHAALQPQHEGRTLTPRQMWNILRIIYPWGLEESKKRRSVLGNETKRTGVPREHKENTPLRKQMTQILNAGSGHIVERTIYLYRQADAGDELAKVLVDEVDSGVKGIYGACNAFDEAREPGARIQNSSEQKTLLDNGSRNLGAQVHALSKLGSPILVDPNDLETYIQSLTASRSKLSTIINQLRAVHRERTHG